MNDWRITLVCRGCGRRKRAIKLEDDPPMASKLEMLFCDKCERGGEKDGGLTYYDGEGYMLISDPEDPNFGRRLAEDERWWTA